MNPWEEQRRKTVSVRLDKDVYDWLKARVKMSTVRSLSSYCSLLIRRAKERNAPVELDDPPEVRPIKPQQATGKEEILKGL